jgi:hypothetical protein
MNRISGSYVVTTTLSESVKAFVPAPLPPKDPALSPACYVEQNQAAELAYPG